MRMLYQIASDQFGMYMPLLLISEARLAPSLCISHPTKSDIHEIIMHPIEEGKILLYAEIQILMSASHSGKKSYSPHIIPKTKGLEESLL